LGGAINTSLSTFNGGEMPVKDLTGKVFGRLTVLKFTHTAKRYAYFDCRCNCGTLARIKGVLLSNGNTKSCGCLHRYSVRNNIAGKNRLPLGEAAFNCLYHSYRLTAKARGFEFLITKEEFRKLTTQKCTYCGIPPHTQIGAKELNGVYTYTGVDRSDSQQGYNIGNCVPCCTTCNRAKSDLPLIEFEEWLRQLVKKRV
jgi:hypothetical protein